MSLLLNRSAIFTCGLYLSMVSAAPVLTPGVWKDITPSGTNMEVSDGYGFNDIQFDPQNPSVLYVCVDEKTAVHPPALFKSVNSGESWTRIGNFDAPTHMYVDPTNSQHLYLIQGVRGSTQGFWISNDGGNTWTLSSSYMAAVADPRIANNDPYNLSVNPKNPNHILLMFHTGWAAYLKVPGQRNVDDDNAGFLESKDGGSSWRIILPRPNSDWHGVGYIVTFLMDPAHNQGDEKTWLLGTQRGGFWRTTDAGETWTQVSKEWMSHGGMQLLYTKTGRIYVAAKNCLIRSDDNGITWTKITNGLPSDWNGDYYAVLSDGNTLYTQPGMWRQSTQRPIYSSPESDGLTWAPYNGGKQLFHSGIYNGVYDKKNQILYTANWMNGVWALKPLNPDWTTNIGPKETKSFKNTRQGIVINPEMNVSRVNFIDMHGRIIKSRTVTPGFGSRISFDGLQPGIYTVIMKADGVKVSNTKIVVGGNQ